MTRTRADAAAPAGSPAAPPPPSEAAAGDRYPLERWRRTLHAAYSGARPIDDPEVRGAVEGAIAALDAGDLRVAEPLGDGWVTHGWLQQAIALYFRLRVSATIEVG